MTESVIYNHSAADALPQKETGRLAFIDTARCIALFLTVFAHLYSVNSSVRLYIYAFHMPLFFLLSGYLHKNTPPGGLIVKMTRRLLVPFAFFLLLGYVYFVISSGSLHPDIIQGSIRGIVLGKAILANDILWFLLALFLVKVVGNLFILHPRIAWAPALFLFVLFYLSKCNWLYLGSAFMALTFYLAGHYGKNTVQAICHSRFSVVYAIVFLGVSVLLSSVNGRVSLMATVFGNTGYGLLDFAIFYLNAIIGCLAILCLASALPSFRLVGTIAKSAISIVGLQFIPIMIWIKYVGHNQPYLLSFSATILIMAGCVLFDRLVRMKAKWLLGGESTRGSVS